MKKLIFVAGTIASVVLLYKTFGEKAGNGFLSSGRVGNGLVGGNEKGNGRSVGGEGGRPMHSGGHESSGGFVKGGGRSTKRLIKTQIRLHRQ